MRKLREARPAIHLSAKLRTEDGWGQVTIANMSSRGLLLKSPFPPGRNTFIEIRHRGETIVGRVVWSNGTRCGVRTQDPINIDALLGKAPIGVQKAGERRSTAAHQLQVKARQLPSVTPEASQRSARAFTWIVMAAVGAAGAVMAAELVATSLVNPFARANTALTTRSHNR